MDRWERMYQIFELLEGNQLTVRELTDMIKEKTITLNFIDSMLRHYRHNGYLTRKKNIFNLYSYELSQKGINQLKYFLQNGEYLEYSNIQIKN